MTGIRYKIAGVVLAVTLAGHAGAGQFVVELAAPLEAPDDDLMTAHDVSINEAFAAGIDSYAIFSATGEAELRVFLDAAAVPAEKVSEVIFINSPTIGGGVAAGSTPRPDHQVFVVERPIPGVGFFGLDKKQRISRSSNAAIAKLGQIVEWDRSYLTGEGTYCVYRADSTETLREHGALAGAPIGKITAVTQTRFENGTQ